MAKKGLRKGVAMKDSTKRSKSSMVVILLLVMSFTAILSGCVENKKPVQLHEETVALTKSWTYTNDGITWHQNEYEYDDQGNVTKIHRFTYEGDKYVEERVEEYEYDDMGRIVKYRGGEVQVENGDINWDTQYQAVYDGKGNIRKDRYENDKHSERAVYEYDRHGVLRKIKIFEKYEDDKKEYLSTYEKYDSRGNIVKEESYSHGKLSWVRKYKYDKQGNIIKEVCYSHGILDNTIECTIEYKYDDLGNLTFKRLDGGYGTGKEDAMEYEYDEQGNEIRETRIINGDARPVIEREYDNRGNITKSVEYAWKGIEHGSDSEYDDRGNRTKYVIYGENGTIKSVTESEYDDCGNKVKTVELEYDENGTIVLRTESEYDGRDMLAIKSVVYDKNGIVKNSYMEYDSLGRPEKYITYNADGNIILLDEYSYDEKGYQTHTHSQRYDENGKITSNIVMDYVIEEATIMIPDKRESENQSKIDYMIPQRYNAIPRPRRYEPASGDSIK